jgi:hypothetical protein
MFKRAFDKYSIIPLFHPDNPEILNNKVERFARFMAQPNRMFARSNILPEFGKSHITWRKPIFGRLQSSNDDVEAEIDIIRAHPAHCDSVLIMLGGDGLTEMRAEHAIARNPAKYLLQCPMLLPHRGDHPHGSNHILHGNWRLWWEWLDEIFQGCDLDAHVKKDFSVSEFKQADWAICIVMRAIAEFLDEVSTGGPIPTAMVTQYLQALSPNLDAAYLVHFLYDFAFMYWQFRKAVRAKDYEKLDLVWRESLGPFNTTEGHKTQYAPMNVTHIYRMQALVPELKAMVDKMRVLHLSNRADSGVGWDMPVEKLNLYLRNTVKLPYEELIERAVSYHNFTGPVANAFQGLMHWNRATARPQEMRDITRTVDKLKDFLYKKLIFKGVFGPLQHSHWEVLIAPSLQSIIRPSLRGKKTPWQKSYEALIPPPNSNKEHFEVFVRRHLDNRVTW